MSDTVEPVKRGDRVTIEGHPNPKVAKVMAVADGYAMLRFPRAVPFVEQVKLLRAAGGLVPHDHREYVEGCFRCALSRQEIDHG